MSRPPKLNDKVKIFGLPANTLGFLSVGLYGVGVSVYFSDSILLGALGILVGGMMTIPNIHYNIVSKIGNGLYLILLIAFPIIPLIIKIIPVILKPNEGHK